MAISLPRLHQRTINGTQAVTSCGSNKTQYNRYRTCCPPEIATSGIVESVAYPSWEHSQRIVTLDAQCP